MCEFWFSIPKLWFDSTPENDIYILKNFNIFIRTELSILGKIILHDQIMRHYIRHNKLSIDIINKYNNKAIVYTNILLESNFLDYKPIEQCFILMPLRHSNDEKDRIRAIDIIVKILKKNPHQPDYMRFYQAALERVSKPVLINSHNEFPHELLCPTSTFNIIKSCDIDIDIPIVIIESYNKLLNKDTIYTISISGGSDSMLCCYIAVRLGYTVIALMIDYGNREEHLKEIDFVAFFCKQLNVPFYIRYINIQRTVDMRDFYEKVTKNIRFNSYKYLNNPVILGHNKDDCFENIITNIASLKSSDNLFGMKSVSEIMGVTIIRPILYIPKHNIVELCNMYNIPFLLDSTPKWSRRGMIRDNIVPVLNEFDMNLIPRMIEFCMHSSEEQSDYNKLLNTINITKISANEYMMDFITPIYSIKYWQGLINRITKIENIKTIKTNTINIMIERIKLTTIPIKISLSINLTIFYQINKVIFIILL